MRTESVIHVALASDQNYFMGLLVTACSIARFVDKNRYVVLHVLDGGLNQESVRLLAERVKAINGAIEIDRIVVNDERFSAYPIWHGSRMTYARILLTEFLPNVDFVIYSDVDVLWMTDISKLWDVRNPACPVQGCVEQFMFPGMLEDEETFYQKYGRSIKRAKNINAGIIIMNLDFLRKDGFSSRALAFLDENPDVPMNDQTAINFLYEDQIEILPDKWNMLTRQVDVSTFEDGVALHYAGSYQPWRAKGLRWIFGDDLLIWHKVNSLIQKMPLLKSVEMSCGAFEFYFRRALFHVFSAPVISSVVIGILANLGAANRRWVRYYYTRYNKRLMKKLPADFFRGWF